MDKLKERSQLGDFGTLFGLPDSYAKSSNKSRYYKSSRAEGINSKGFSATYKNNEISYCFVTDPVTRNINALIDMKQNHMDSLQLELFSMNIFDSLKSTKVKEKIKLISEQIAVDICADHPSAFWNRKRHIVTLPYEESFSEDDIPTKSWPCQMNVELVEFCKNEIDNLLQKDLIKPSKSPWSCTTFYVNSAVERERGWIHHGFMLKVGEGEDQPQEDHPKDRHTDPQLIHNLIKDRHTDPHQTPRSYKWEEEL
ncbi:uncharacterized protein LOC125828743 [Solanum verrucosum]|uniref:uncharacterized protein LOC125828743 n=1 Tax=Solanum verrucosum TaxID=315347 RepID=UPI0020D0BE06|nr:uncharacterized protein LOC125828743 [Solanum verrucosum]